MLRDGVVRVGLRVADQPAAASGALLGDEDSPDARELDGSRHVDEADPLDLDGPESVAAAVIDLITGPLLANPHQVGKPLRRELEGVWSARRGTFRLLYRIDEARREVVVLRVDRRADVYRRP